MARPPLPIGAYGKITTREVRPRVFRSLTWFRDSDGASRRVTATGPTKPAAERTLKQVLADRAAPSGELIDAEMRVSQVAEAWLTLYAAEGHVETSTVAEYRRVVDNIINPAIGNIRLREATAGRIERLIVGQPSQSRRKKVKTVLGMMLDTAVLDDAIPANPVRSTSKLRNTKKDVRVLSVEDLHAVRSAVRAWTTEKRPGPTPNQDVPDIIDLLLATGCRIGEVLALRWSDIDLTADKPTVGVSGTIKTENGKGTYRKPKPKSDASIRTVTLPPFAVQMLLRRRVSEPANHYNAVFATRNGTWHQVGNIERRWRKIRQDTGFEWVTPHTFRKTVATLIDKLVDSETAAKQLGHASDDITKQFYIQKDQAAPDVSHILQSFAGSTSPSSSHFGEPADAT